MAGIMKNKAAIVSLISIFILLFTIVIGCIDSEEGTDSKKDKDNNEREGKTFSDCIVNLEPDTRTENKDYVLKVETVTCANDLSVGDLQFTLFSADRRDMSNGVHEVINIYGKPINDKNFISFRDGDNDGKLSIGDRFILKSFEHVDDDGSTDSPGFAEPGFFFELRAGKFLISEEQIW